MEYHKIETLFERDEKTHRLKPELILKNPVYGIIKTWQFTEKIDGTNIRIIWNPESRVTFGGKTENAQIHADLITWLYENITDEKMRAIFPDTSVVLYGEGYGAGIQKGGGNYSQTKKLILFDVLVGGKWWLSDENMRDVAAKLSIEAVPLIGEMTLEEATEYVRHGFQSRLNGGKAKAEGLVGRPIECLFDKQHRRIIIKLKTKDFA